MPTRIRARFTTRRARTWRRCARAAPLVEEDAPALYFYRLRMGGHEQTGLAGCFSLDDYDRDVIKKHERTRRDKEDDRTRHIVQLRAQTGVVFLTYRRTPPSIASRRRSPPARRSTTSRRPTACITPSGRRAPSRPRRWWMPLRGIPLCTLRTGITAPRARHGRGRNWPARRPALAMRPITSSRWRFPTTRCRSCPYNRTVKDLAGATAAQFLAALRQRVPVSRRARRRRRRQGEVSMFLAGQLVHARSVGGHAGGRVARRQPRRGTAAERVLEPILSIGDIRTDKRIDFVGGARGSQALEQAVDSGKAAVAFSMFPVTVEDLIAISDAGSIMPPKSTWFEPKLRDGLLVHEI